LTTGNARDMKTPITTHKRFHYLPRSSTGWANPGIFAGSYDIQPSLHTLYDFIVMMI
jgi:hypothetical protein